MKKGMYTRVLTLTRLFAKEHLNEPIAFFWIMISPCALFYFFAITRQDTSYFLSNYTAASAWFYAYISSSVALFGFAFYIIGRRESGFVRSFIYSRESRAIFLYSHFLAYSLISIAYCGAFYPATRLPFGGYELKEFLDITLRFYICFVMFCILGIVFALPPINFQNSNTPLSIISFCMLILGVMGASRTNEMTDIINSGNPLMFANRLMAEGLEHNKFIVITILLTFAAAFSGTLKYLRINPVWSRY
ncbi:ABC transporter permease [Pseudomonas sp. H11T01]|uniref:ABC transporter permease n=1 Tax=Pseudomonas sp. H11T01 TaxID=3402749 RepID=UPI003ABE02D6